MSANVVSVQPATLPEGLAPAAHLLPSCELATPASMDHPTLPKAGCKHESSSFTEGASQGTVPG